LQYQIHQNRKVPMLDHPLLTKITDSNEIKNAEFSNEVLQDYWLCCISREASILGRREVLTGKAKFGIIGDGKEVPQIVLSKYFKKGDWRSGYYRDQTMMFALGVSTLQQFFAQLYADSKNDPFSGGRQMNSHFATPLIDENGEWLDTRNTFNVSADISCTGGQMARGLGVAFASKKYRENLELSKGTKFSNEGNEICYVTIGDASTSEGVFLETINAAGVTQVPMVISVWDDGYGISVPKEFQTTKASISEVLKGFQRNSHEKGLEIINVKGWDYPALIKAYEKAEKIARTEHVPVLVHVEQLTQPQGHSTSGSHERYKTKERLAWEVEFDCLAKMKQWMLDSKLASKKQLSDLEEEAKNFVKDARDEAWLNFQSANNELKSNLGALVSEMDQTIPNIAKVKTELDTMLNPTYSELLGLIRQVIFELGANSPQALVELKDQLMSKGRKEYNTHLYAEDSFAAIRQDVVPANYLESSPFINGYQILNKYFDQLLANNPAVYAFGEDVGNIGDVNQGFAGLQKKYGADRVFDTGIREWTIMGQAIGMALRGLRPIAEIQYLDYLVYGLEPLTDDLATLRYRTNGTQCAPAIIRTRGHRLEGIWHAGSPMALLLNSLKGMHICVPRNMVQAVGMYNTAMKSKDPVLVIECLNGYRLKEQLPENLSEVQVPYGVPEVLVEGTDITLVTYGSTLRIAEKAIEAVAAKGISVELIDVQTLLPFDLESRIVQSLKKTNKIIFVDEDVPGGATAFMMQNVLEEQGGYEYLDAKPVTLTGKAHRPAYGSAGDYFSKPNHEDIIEALYAIMQDAEPDRFPKLF